MTVFPACFLRRGHRDDRGLGRLQHPLRDRDVRALLQDGAAPHVVAALPRLHLLLHLAPRAHHLLPRRGRTADEQPENSLFKMVETLLGFCLTPGLVYKGHHQIGLKFCQK